MAKGVPQKGKRLTALAKIAATNPIEVCGFIIVTLAYFQMLHALKDSDFLNADIISGPAHLDADSSPLGPALTLSRAGSRWIGVSTGAKGDSELYLQQVVISKDDFGRRQPESSTLNLAEDTDLMRYIENFDLALRNGPIVSDSNLALDPDLCYRPNPKQPCFSVSPFSQKSTEHHALFTNGNAVSLFYAFASDTEDGQREWLAKLQQSEELGLKSHATGIQFENKVSFTPINQRQPTGTSSARSAANDTATPPLIARLANSLRLSKNDLPRVSLVPRAPRTGQLREMQSSSWLFYGFKAFIMQFWRLLKQADSADIFIMVAAYLIMHLTFLKLYFNTRKLGHKFWLATCTLVSSVFAFLIALDTAYLLNMTVNPVILSEALPFLVIIIGFEKPYVLARAVFRNPAVIGHYSDGPLSRPDLGFFHLDKRSNNGSVADEPPSASIRERFESKPAKDIVIEAIDKHGTQIVRDYAIEIVFLLAGSMAGISGLTEFCQLAALILAFDCVFLFVFYSSVLVVLIEVRRIKRMRGLRRADSTSDLARFLDDGADSPPPQVTEENSLTYKQSVVKLVTGITPNAKSGTTSLRPTPKLLLLGAFFGVHVFNLLTPLATGTAINRHNASSLSPYAFSRSDSTSPAVAYALQQLSDLHPLSEKIVAHLAPPLLIRMNVGTGALSTTLTSELPVAARATPLAVLDRFMSAWSMLAGDPVISKWIVITLVISVFLNGYLLKGIALVDTDRAQAAQNAARILLASTGQLAYDEDRPSKIARRHSSAQQGNYERDIDETSSVTHSPPLLTMPPRMKRMSAEQKASYNPSLARVTEAEPPREQQPAIAVTRPSIPITPTTASDISSMMSSDLGTMTPATTVESDNLSEDAIQTPRPPRSFEECLEAYDAGRVLTLTDEELIILVQKGKLAAYSLETVLKNHSRAVRVRRALISRASTTKTLEASELPYMHYDYSKVMGQCCENVVGYVPIPVGIAGPLRIDGTPLPIPMATTEGALVASTSRGCKALNAGGGVITALTQDAMTRGPALEFNSITECAAARLWIEEGDGDFVLKAAFNSTSRFARLQRLKCANAGRTLFVRFATQTGDAMGMNMISKGCERALEAMLEHFPNMRIIALSGNYCTDKKPAAINWIEGRGKSVVSECVVPGNVVKTILKTTVADIVKLNISKNLVGSAMAGSIGGNNAHASNVLTAVYLACGQDPAQNVESSNCMTLMEAVNDGKDLLITCTMPSIEVGTIGGGTILTPQRAMLDMLGVGGPHPTQPGANAQRLARIICAAVMAGELSLMSALAAGHLVKSHLALNRSQPVTPSTNKVTKHTFLTPAPSPGPSSLRQRSFLTPLKGLE